MAVHRNRETLERVRRTLTMVALVGLAIGGVGLVRALGGGAGPYTPWAGASLAIMGLAALGLIRRLTRVGVETDRDGIVVRNLLSTRRLAWSEIDGFEEGRRRGITNAAVRTSSGRRRALAGVGDPGRTADEILSALRLELETARRG